MRSLIEALFVVSCLFSFLPVPAQAQAAADRIEKPILDGLSFVGHNGQNGAHLMDVEIAGDRAYLLVGMSYGLETYDISNPAAPVRLDRQGPAAWNAKAYGDRLYVFSRDKGFRIYDISGSIPVLLGEYDPADPNTLYENGALRGQTLYAAAHQKGIDVFDVSNPASPVLIDNIPLARSACWDVETSGAFLFVAGGRFGLSVVALTSPPVETASLPLPGLANHILLDGSTAVLSLGPEGIGTADVSKPAAPRLLDTARSRGNAFGSGILDHKLVVGSWSFLEIYDISDPERIERTAFDDTKTWAMGADIKAYGNGGLIVVADWRGMSTYLSAPDGPPDIEVNPRDLDFGEVAGSEQKRVVVYNRGGSDLNVGVSGLPSGIAVAPSSFTVPSGSSRKITVTATGSGTVNGSIIYGSNDPDEPALEQYVYKNNTTFPQVDSMAPGFMLADLDGFWHDIEDLRGTVVYMEFGELW